MEDKRMFTAKTQRKTKMQVKRQMTDTNFTNFPGQRAPRT